MTAMVHNPFIRIKETGGMMNNIFGASHSNLSDQKDKIVTDLERLASDAEDMLSEVASYTTDEFATARSKIDGKLCDAKSRLSVARNVVTEKARAAVDGTQEYVRENPWTVLGVAAAAAAGVIAYAVLTRRLPRE